MSKKDDSPSYVEYYMDGNISEEYWCNERDNDLPIEVHYFKNGQVKYKKWKENRDNDLPTNIRYYESGNVQWNSWDCGRKFGPSYIEYNESGEVICEVNFCWEWEEVSKEEYLRLKAIKDFEDELLNTIPENDNISKVIKF